MSVCDIGMTLDIPTPRAWKQINDKKISEDRMYESKDNALEMLKYKDENIGDALNPDFQLYNCIHGTTLDQMEEWHRETTDNHNVEYDGFSLSTSKFMKYLLPLRLGFAIENSNGKPFHLLGVASPSSQALIAYANKYIDTQIYFDSTAAATGKMLRKFMFL
jgi:queuine/archaeosine tRNA-ribosyltransferase